MKKHTRILIVLAAMSLFTLYSCEEDDLDGMFDDPVEKFLGNWKCFETGDLSGSFGPFDIQIVRNPSNSSEVFIRNFNYQGMNEQARAIIAGNNITIPRQRICDDTIEIIGSGSFANGEISLTYKTNDGADEENITARIYKP